MENLLRMDCVRMHVRVNLIIFIFRSIYTTYIFNRNDATIEYISRGEIGIESNKTHQMTKRTKTYTHTHTLN